MHIMLKIGIWTFVVIELCLPRPASAQVTQLDLEVVASPAFDGQHFGDIGQYEHLRGTAYAALDPSHRLNRDIINIQKAPRNQNGLVEYSTTVEIYRPINMHRWNKAIYHTVPNRGGAGAGERVLLEMGFALVRVGWQGDIPGNPKNIVAFLPVAKDANGTSIHGQAIEEFIFNDRSHTSRARLTYPLASQNVTQGNLTVRQHQTDPRQTPADLKWRAVNLNEIEIQRPSAFDGGAIYEFTYIAKDPIVMGLGFAAVRDVISFLRYTSEQTPGITNPLEFEGLSSTVISLGISQSGRFLRDMLYQGFNEDLNGEIIFDGIHPDIAGSRKTFTNYQFSQPGRWQKQHEDHLYPGDHFPFTYVEMADPISGRTDGIQNKCALSKTCPKILHTDGEAELWQARSSLIVTTPTGEHVDLPDNVRTYLIAGTQHGGGPGIHSTRLTQDYGSGICQNLANPLSLREIRSALSVALYRWVAFGQNPPPSRFPTIANGGLIKASDLNFPALRNVMYSGSVNTLRDHDHSVHPPQEGGFYSVLVGRVNSDGNMIDGVHPPNLTVPIGTHTGWNLRSDGYAEGGQCGGTGSFIPFSANKTNRSETGDPRKSLAERYSTHQEYVTLLSQAVEQLVNSGYLLASDGTAILALAIQTDIGSSHE